MAPQSGTQPGQCAPVHWHALHCHVKIPGFPDGHEHAGVARVAVFVHMPLAQRKVGLPKPARRLVLFARHGNAVHGGQHVGNADGFIGKQCGGQGPRGGNGFIGWQHALAVAQGRDDGVPVQQGRDAVFACAQGGIAAGKAGRQEEGGDRLAGELGQVGHATHFIQQPGNVLGPLQLQLEPMGEQPHPGAQPAVHAQRALGAMAPQQIGDGQRTAYVQQPIHRGVVRLQVAGNNEVRGALRCAARQGAFDVQVAVDEHPARQRGQRLPGRHQGVQRAASGQGRCKVQRGQAQVARKAGHPLAALHAGQFLQAPGQHMAAGQAGGNFGQGGNAEGGHGKWQSARPLAPWGAGREVGRKSGCKVGQGGGGHRTPEGPEPPRCAYDGGLSLPARPTP